MRALLLASVGLLAGHAAAANAPAAAPAPTPAPGHPGGCGRGDCGGQDDYVLTRVSKIHQQCPQVKTRTVKQCTKTVIRPEYHTVTAYKQSCNNCGSCGNQNAVAYPVSTVTVYNQAPPYTIPYPVTSTIFNNIGGGGVNGTTITVGAATVTVTNAAVTIVSATTVTVATTTIGAPVTANTQPVKNGGFVQGLASWTSTSSNGANITASHTVGLVDFTNSTVDPNAGLDSAMVNIPTNVTAATNPVAVLTQNITLVPSTMYVLSFFVNLGQSLSTLATVPALQPVLLSLLNVTSLAGVGGSTPLASLAQCQVGTLIQTTGGSNFSHTFPFATVQNGSITPLLAVGANGTSWTRLDTYFTTAGGDSAAVLSFSFQCPGLSSVVPPSLTTGLTTGLGALTGLTGLLGNLLGAEGATSIAINLDQVTIDYYANP